MKDSKIKSFTESIFNIIVGLGISFVANMFILPMFGMPYNLVSFGVIGVIYTIISLVRSYILRRLFVNGFYEFIMKFKKRWL